MSASHSFLPLPLLQAVLAQVPLRLSLKRADGCYVWLNPAAALALGANAAPGRFDADLLPEAQWRAERGIEAALLLNGPADVRDEPDAATGVVWRVTRQVLAGQEGERLLLTCAAERGGALEPLALSAAHEPGPWRSLIDQLPFGVSLKTADGELKMVNAYTAKRVNRTPQQLEGHTMAVVADRVRDQMTVMDAEVVATGQPMSAEFETRQAFGLDEERVQRVSKSLVHLAGIDEPLVLTTTVEVTDLRRAEQRAQRSMELLRAVTDTSPSMVFVKDQEQRYVLVNSVYCQAVGLSEAEMLGHTPFEIHPKNHTEIERWVAADRQVLATGEPHEQEDRMMLNGVERIVWSVKRPLRVANGQRQVLCVATDITAMRRAESELAQQRQLLRAIADADPNIIFVKDAKQRYVMVNRAYCEIYGRTEAELLGRTPAELIGAEAEPWTNADLEVLATGLEVVTPTRQVDQAGVERHFVQYKRPLKGPDGATLVLGVGVEVTELRRQQLALERQHALIRTVIDTDDVLMFMKDEQGRFALANAGAVKFFQRQEADFLGRTSLEVFGGEMGSDTLALDQRAWVSPGPVQAVQTMVMHGEQREFETSRQLVDGPEGNRLLLVVARDVTELRRTEAALRDALHRAEQASEAKSRFLANISHEIRTPINGMMGMTDLVLASSLQPRQREYLQVARASADALLGIVNEVLDLTKIDAGGMTVEQVRFDLHALLRELSQSTASTAYAKGLDFELQLQPALPRWVQGDPVRLRQVLANLLGNACKFTEAGWVVFTIANEPGHAVRFTVRDTGPGIAPERQQRVFEAFAQGDDSTTRRYGGTGLGLTISARLVELMGGHLALDSTPGLGSSFEFSLALPADAALEPPARPLAGRRIAWLGWPLQASGFLPQCLCDWGAQVQKSEAVDLATLEPAADSLVVQGPLAAAEQALVRHWLAAHPARRLVSLQRLDAELESGPDGAARLSLPVLPQELLQALTDAAPGTASPAHFPDGSDAVPLQGWRVLLAEDNAVNRLVVQAVVERLGGQLTCAEDGQQAWKLLQRDGYDLVLMDIQMPRIDGVEVLQRRRALEAAEGLPRARIMALTAHAMQGDRERFLAEGFDAYLSKPFSMEQLSAEITRLDAATTD